MTMRCCLSCLLCRTCCDPAEGLGRAPPQVIGSPELLVADVGSSPGSPCKAMPADASFDDYAPRNPQLTVALVRGANKGAAEHDMIEWTPPGTPPDMSPKESLQRIPPWAVGPRPLTPKAGATITLMTLPKPPQPDGRTNYSDRSALSATGGRTNHPSQDEVKIAFPGLGASRRPASPLRSPVAAGGSRTMLKVKRVMDDVAQNPLTPPQPIPTGKYAYPPGNPNSSSSPSPLPPSTMPVRSFVPRDLQQGVTAAHQQSRGRSPPRARSPNAGNTMPGRVYNTGPVRPGTSAGTIGHQPVSRRVHERLMSIPSTMNRSPGSSPQVRPCTSDHASCFEPLRM